MASLVERVYIHISTAVPLPVIVTHPDDLLDVLILSNITFSVDAEGLRLNFQWLRTDGDTLLTSLERIVGEDTSSLTIYKVELGDVGTYACEVYNGAGRVRSEDAVLTVSKWSLCVSVHECRAWYTVCTDIFWSIATEL